jgi:antitoxin PrlF
MPVATVTSKGQVTVPKEIRDALHIRAGDRLQFTLREDGSLVVRVRNVDLRDLVGRLKARRRVTVEEIGETAARGWAGELGT